jgi:hypothetical protein
MSQNFDLWVACQRVFNVTPAIVDDQRTLDGGGVVRFLATTRSDSHGVYLEEIYEDEESVLATGWLDKDETERVLAAEEDFMGAPAYLVIRAAQSYFHEDTFCLEVEVFVNATDATRDQVIEAVKKASIYDSFENLWLERHEEDIAAGQPAEPPRSAEVRKQGRSLLDRWFRKRA